MEFTSKSLYFSLFGVIALLSCIHTIQSVGHDYNIGFCTDIIWNRSIPLATKVVHKNNNRFFSMFRKIDLELRFPEQGEFSAPIKCIMTKDNSRDGKNGFTTVRSGGVGYRYVVLYFRSQRGGDINFEVGIYADASRVGGGAVQPHYAPQPTYPAVQPAYTAQQMGWNQQRPPQYGWNYPPPNQTYGR